jgi:general secretion pathway protein N
MMPPLQSAISLLGENILLDVREEESSQTVMQLQLMPKGSVLLLIRKRLLDLAGAPWSQSAHPDDVIFKIEQKLI